MGSADLSELFDNVLEGSVGFHHPLVMASTLGGGAGANKFARHSIEMVLSLFVGIRFDQIDVLGQKGGVFEVLLQIPMLFVVFVGSAERELAFFGPIEPRPYLLDVFLGGGFVGVV